MAFVGAVLMWSVLPVEVRPHNFFQCWDLRDSFSSTFFLMLHMNDHNEKDESDEG